MLSAREIPPHRALPPTFAACAPFARRRPSTSYSASRSGCVLLLAVVVDSLLRHAALARLTASYAVALRAASLSRRVMRAC